MPGTAFAWLQEVVAAFNDGGACCIIYTRRPFYHEKRELDIPRSGNN